MTPRVSTRLLRPRFSHRVHHGEVCFEFSFRLEWFLDSIRVTIVSICIICKRLKLNFAPLVNFFNWNNILPSEWWRSNIILLIWNISIQISFDYDRYTWEWTYIRMEWKIEFPILWYAGNVIKLDDATLIRIMRQSNCHWLLFMLS